MRHRRATSILEVIIALSVGALIFVLLAQVTGNMFTSFRRSSTTEDANSKANAILDTMTRSIRQAQPSPTGAQAIAAASGTSISFYASISNNGQIDLLRYTLQGNAMLYGRIQPTGNPPIYNPAQETVTTILTNIQNGATPVFDYFDSAFTGAQAPMNPITIGSVRLIRITLLYDPKPTELPAAATLRMEAQLRNLKDNY